MNKKLAALGGPLFLLLLVSCGGGDGTPTNNGNTDQPSVEKLVADTRCVTTVDDSPEGATSGRIHAEKFPNTYVSNVITRSDSLNSNISVDYMVHEPSIGPAKALLILLPGGNGNAGFVGDGAGGVKTASGNFLVRSADLFARQGYKVVTVNRPSDYAAYADYDDYRRSARHAIDLSIIINKENSANLPVIAVGTSRGTISAVAQHRLVDAVALSSPVTSGDSGTPLSESSPKQRLRPSSVTVPAHVMLHIKDACSVSPPAGAIALVPEFDPAATLNVLDGGYNATDKTNDCQANGYHGFFGIESCAVGKTTDWIAGLSLPSSRPIQGPMAEPSPVDPGATVSVTLPVVTAANSGAIIYSLPHGKTSLGGIVSISGATVTYTAPAIGGVMDTFIYIAEEVGGGKVHGTISIQINPLP